MGDRFRRRIRQEKTFVYLAGTVMSFSNCTSIETISGITMSSEAFWGIFGTIIGVLLGSFIDVIKDRISNFFTDKELKESIKEELASICDQIDVKIDIVLQMIASLKRNAILPGITTPTMNRVYTGHIGVLPRIYSREQRNALHVIHENMIKIDEILNNFSKDIRQDILTGVINDPMRQHVDALYDILDSYEMTKELIYRFQHDTLFNVFSLRVDRD